MTRLGPYTVGGPGAGAPGPTVIPVSEFYHMYILSYRQGSYPALPESVLMTSTMYKNGAKCSNGRKTIPIDRAVAQCFNGREAQASTGAWPQN